MENNELNSVNDLIELINNEVEQMKTIVVRDQNDSTSWLDIDDSSETQLALDGTKMLFTLGVVVLEKWDKIKHHFSKDIQEQVETFFEDMVESTMLELAKGE